jgi:hypothetical protein
MPDDISDRLPLKTPLDERFEQCQFGLLQRLIVMHIKVNAIGPERMSQKDFGG